MPQTRVAQMVHLVQLGWTHEEIAAVLDVSRQTIDLDAKTRQLSDFHIPEEWNTKWIEQEAERLNLPTLLLLTHAPSMHAAPSVGTPRPRAQHPLATPSDSLARPARACPRAVPWVQTPPFA